MARSVIVPQLPGVAPGLATTDTVLGLDAFGAAVAGSIEGLNTAIGWLALGSYTNATPFASNTAVGALAGGALLSGSGNTLIGAAAGSNLSPLTAGSNNTIIGRQAESSSGTVSNEITLGNADITAFRVPGVGILNTAGKQIFALTNANALLLAAAPFAEADDSIVGLNRLKVFRGGSTPRIIMGFAGTSLAAPSAAANADGLGVFECRAFDGTSFVACAQITAVARGAFAVGDMPTELRFGVSADNTASVVDHVALTQAGLLAIGPSVAASSAFPALKRSTTFVQIRLADDSGFGSLQAAGITSPSPTAGIGYATGAGGAQTQATSKATTVVSNTITTAITMHNATLNAGVIVSFTFTNSSIAATDTVIVEHVSAGTQMAYNFATFPGAGSCVIAVKNVTAGNLGEAIVLRVTVIKSVSA